MVKEFSEIVKRTRIETNWWRYSAWTLPFLALSIVAFEHFIGWESHMAKTIVIISVVFFTISVLWWWWALTKIVTILEGLKRTEDNFLELRKDIKETKEEFTKRFGD